MPTRPMLVVRSVAAVLICLGCSGRARRAIILQDDLFQRARHAEVKQALAKILFMLHPPAAAALSTSPGIRTPRVLRLRDAVTKQDIRLVGTMHGHPVSQNCVREEIARALEQDDKKLGAVVVELCEKRWEFILETPEGDASLSNEFCAAAVAAQQNGVPIMLGDTDAPDIVDRFKEVAMQTVRDLLNPFKGGWQAISDDIQNSGDGDTSDIAQSELLFRGQAPLSWKDFATQDFVMGFFQIKEPLRRAAIIWSAALILLEACLIVKSIDDVATGEVASMTKVLSEVPWLFVALPIFAGLTRSVSIVFYEERNVELARSIRRAATERNAPVVAILGAGHVNKVARLLMSDERPTSDGPAARGTWAEVPADQNFEASF